MWGELSLGELSLGRVVLIPFKLWVDFFLLLSERKQYRHIETTKLKFGKFCNNMKRIP